MSDPTPLPIPIPIPVNKPVICRQCGYDIRGTISEVCPECGAAKIWEKITYFDWDEFFEASLRLEEAGIQIIKKDSKLGVTGFVMIGQYGISEIWIGKPNMKEAREVLANAGLAIPAPLVDREEPICPTCNKPLVLDGPTICKSCNEPFSWFDIDEQEGEDANSA